MDDLAKTFAWPIAVFCISGLFMLVFRTSIKDAIGRLKSVSKDGVDLHGLRLQQAEVAADADAVAAAEVKGQTKAPQVAISAVAHELMMNIADSPALAATVQDFGRDLESRHLDISSEAAQVLLRYVAAATMWLGFEQVYLWIFGSQIRLLKEINQSKGMSAIQVASFIDAVKQQQVELASFTNDGYMHFLVSHRLVFLDEQTWRLTPYGTEFLIWMVRQGRQENKNY